MDPQNRAGGSTEQLPAWWDTVTVKDKARDAWTERKLARAFDAFCGELAKSPLWVDVQAELTQLAPALTDSGNARRTALAALLAVVDLSVGTPEQLRDVIRRLLLPENTQLRVAALLQVEPRLEAYMYDRLAGPKPGATDYDKIASLGRDERILPFDPDRPTKVLERRAYQTQLLETYRTRRSLGLATAADCWQAAYEALALARSAQQHPDQAFSVQATVHDELWVDAIAMLCLAALRFRSALIRKHPDDAIGRDAKLFPAMDFIDVKRRQTMATGRPHRPNSGFAAPVDARASEIFDTQPMAPTAPRVVVATASPLAPTGNRGISKVTLAVVATAVALALVAAAVHVARPRPQVAATSAQSAEPDAVILHDTSDPVAARTPAALLESCRKLQGGVNATAMMDNRLEGADGIRQGTAYLVAALTGLKPGVKRILITAPSGMGKTTLAEDVASRVCTHNPETFLLSPGHLKTTALPENSRIEASDWLQRAAGLPSASTEVAQWLAHASPILIVDGLDEIHGANRAAFMQGIDAVQTTWHDARFLVLTRSSPSLDLAGRNYDVTFKIPRLDQQETRLRVERKLGDDARADAFFATARRFGLTQSRMDGERQEYRFLSTFDDVNAALEASRTNALFSRRELFDNWLLLRLPKALNLTSSESAQLNEWLDAMLAKHLDGAAEQINLPSALLEACRQVSNRAPLDGQACAALFSRETLLDDGDGPGEHTVVSLLVARGVANQLAAKQLDCSIVDRLDQDAAAFLLGYPVGRDCAKEILESICNASNVEDAVDLVDTGLSFARSERAAWLHAAAKATRTDAAAHPCAAEVLARVTALGASR